MSILLKLTFFIAFRTAVAVANVTDMNDLFGLPSLVEQGLPLTQNWTQQVALTGERYMVTFSISILYLICSILSSLLAVVAIAPLYWNSWKGRAAPLSFNPLDVARVFEAPLLRDMEHEKNIEEYLRKENGLRRVKCYTLESDGVAGVPIPKIKADDI